MVTCEHTGYNDVENHVGDGDVGDNDGKDQSYDDDNNIEGNLGVGVVAGWW